jgi:hypothetical protein
MGTFGMTTSIDRQRQNVSRTHCASRSRRDS